MKHVVKWWASGLCHIITNIRSGKRESVSLEFAL